MTSLAQHYALPWDESAPRWFLGAPTQVKATAEQTGGAFGLVEQVLPAGFASPYHVHRREDESFYVVSGELTFFCGDQVVRARAGTFVFGPRHIPHGFRVDGTGPARLLLLATPGGFEQFVLDLGEAAAPAGPPDMAKLAATAARYEVELLGP